MTDAQFEAFMKRLNRTIDRDTKNASRPPRDATQQDHVSDVEFHRYNQEWTGDPK